MKLTLFFRTFVPLILCLSFSCKKDKSIPPILNVSFDYLILANKSVKDLNQIFGKVQFKNLVIDGSYTRWYADKLSAQAEEMGLKSYDLSKSGALKIE